jgi:hypothetical protein
MKILQKLLQLLFIIFCAFFILVPSKVYAGESFVNIVMPVRGSEFWSNQVLPGDSFKFYYDQIHNRNLPTTWLLRFDALQDPMIVQTLKNSNDEKGLFLEVTPTMAVAAGVTYHQSSSWHQVSSVLLTGYAPDERVKLIDAYFNEFKLKFGYYPISVGAWWIDADSLTYMTEKYKITSDLIVSDQHSTDGYQVWGLFWSSPFYPSKFNASQPAQSKQNKIGPVSLQWAARDPYNGYGERVEDSTYSVQANDYLPYHDLSIEYFAKLLDIFTIQNSNPYGQLTVGIENDFTHVEFRDEFTRQLDEIKKRQSSNQIRVVTMQQFGHWFQSTFKDLSPAKVIDSQNPLDPSTHVVWISNNQYRAGLFFTPKGVILRDLRQYSETMDEPCLKSACTNLDLARTRSKPLDDVTYHQHVTMDEGLATQVLVDQQSEKLVVSYINALGEAKKIEFLQHDIVYDDRPHTITGLIIDATNPPAKQTSIDQHPQSPLPIIDLWYSLKSFLFFLLISFVGILLPGRLVYQLLGTRQSIYEEIFISMVCGLGLCILISIAAILLGFGGLAWFILIGLGLWSLRFKPVTVRLSISVLPAVIFVIGVVVSLLPVVKSGLVYPFGIGFWGPNGHDAIWHLAVIQSLQHAFPPQNYLLSGTTLSNYHYFVDLLVSQLTWIPSLDPLNLYFRLWPGLVSILIGMGSWILAKRLHITDLGISLLLGLIFLGGSFGWILSYIRQGDFGGESMFWANQAVSLHLNPPFALSLVFVLGILILVDDLVRSKSSIWRLMVISILVGLSWSVKSYAGILLLGSMSLVAILNLVQTRGLQFIKLAALSWITSLVVFLPLNWGASKLLEFNPFWLIHSMIDSQDRLNWTRFAVSRQVYTITGNYPKLLAVEGIGLITYLVGNMAVRIIGIGAFVRIWRERNPVVFMLFCIWLLGLLPTLLFVQKGNPWNIVQFLYYAMFVSCFLTVLVLERIFNRMFLAKVVCYVILLVLAIPTTYSTLSLYYPGNAHASVSPSEIQALSALKAAPSGVVLTYPFDQTDKEGQSSPLPLYTYVPSAYVAAFSDKPTFLSDEMNLEILGVEYQKRQIAENEFFKQPTQRRLEKLRQFSPVDYIYTLKSKNFQQNDLKLDTVYENQEVQVFKVKS